MSEQELIGRFGADYTRAKAELARKQSEAKHYAGRLSEFSRLLDQLALGVRVDVDPKDCLTSYPGGGVLVSLIDDIEVLSNQMRTAEAELKRLGFPFPG